LGQGGPCLGERDEHVASEKLGSYQNGDGLGWPRRGRELSGKREIETPGNDCKKVEE